LHAREQWHINQNKEICVNQQKAYTGLTEQEYRTMHNKHLYEKNREIVKSYNKPYYEKNMEKAKTWKNTRVQCDCGKVYTKTHKSWHEQTFIHQEFLKMIP
jgi:hypothetical protein